MSCEFTPGTYTVNTGKSLFDKSDNASSYYTLRFHSKLDPSLPNRKATLRQENENYIAEWMLEDGIASYEGAPGNLQEMECLLVFDEETKTFTIERPSIKMTMKKVRRKKGTTSSSSSSLTKPGTEAGSVSSKSIPTEKITKAPSTTKDNKDTTESTKTNTDSPITLALPPPKKPDTQKEEVVDSFDDIMRDMDDILNSNDDDDDDDDENKESNNNNKSNMNVDDDDDDDDDIEFETITTPYIPPSDTNNTANTPSSIKSPQSMGLTPNQGSGKRRRPAVKMASAPIRRLDASPTTPAPISTPSPSVNNNNNNTPVLPQQGNKRPRMGGKTTSQAMLEARRKAVALIDSDSDSGSSSSGSSGESGSSSEDDGDSSSGSSSSDDDDDILSLAENITRGLSEEKTAPSSSSTPQHQYKASPHRQPNSSTPTVNRTVGPTSLRDLLDGGSRGQDEEVSSSGSSSEEEL